VTEKGLQLVELAPAVTKEELIDSSDCEIHF
jgi:acyl CoA:acetate/3-ketoacid CoA transferase beta subunit